MPLKEWMFRVGDSSSLHTPQIPLENGIWEPSHTPDLTNLPMSTQPWPGLCWLAHILDHGFQ